MQVFDTAHFDHMTGADRALQREVIDLFRAQVDGWEAAMADRAHWRDTVHTIKGSARGIGLSALAAACEAAEHASDLASADATLAPVRAALSDALAALEQYAATAA
jgi:HPt (histidine-containing phosphotransfer) domain-containing protein